MPETLFPVCREKYMEKKEEKNLYRMSKNVHSCGKSSEK